MPGTADSGASTAGPGDSRRLRAPTRQPPATSNTGRTRVPTGERSGPAARLPTNPGARPAISVSIVAGEEEHDRLHRIARMCGLEIPLVTSTSTAPADARIITIGQPWSPNLDPRVIYVARLSITNEALADLLTAIASGRSLAAPVTLGKPSNPVEARRAQIAFTGSRSFAAAHDLAAAETGAIATVRELLDADRAYFLVYDDVNGGLRSPTRLKTAGGDDRRAIAGIAGWVARTGRSASAERATADARWLAPIDDPDGDPNSQLLVQPVVAAADQRVLAVIIAARRPRRPGFGDLDASLAERFAVLVAPILEQLLDHVESQPVAGAPTREPPRAASSPLERLVARVRGWFGRRS